MRPGRRDDAGIAEVLSSVLVVAITTIMMGGLAVLLFNLPGPEERVHADLGLALDKGAAGWGSGDEKVVLQHLGGEPLSRGRTTIRISVDGAPPSTYENNNLGTVFDGDFVLGEEWTNTRVLAQNVRVKVDVVGPQTLVFSDEIKAG